MTKRVLTGACLVAIIGTAIWMQGWVLRMLLLLFMLLSMREMYQAFVFKGLHPDQWVGYIFAIAVTLAQINYNNLGWAILDQISPTLLVLLVSMLLSMAVIIIKGRVDLESLLATIFPMLYPGMFYVLMLAIQDLNGRVIPIVAMAIVFLVSNAADALALVIGVKFGKHKLSPNISPKKTVEGAIAGLVTSVVFAMLIPAVAEAYVRIVPVAQPYIDELPLPPAWAFAILGLIAGLLSILGDLTASMVKRYCGVKDYGKIFPGHGGVMDRMDGVLFCGVACYIFFKILGY